MAPADFDFHILKTYCMSYLLRIIFIFLEIVDNEYIILMFLYAFNMILLLTFI